MNRFGIVGAGNMGGAILEDLAKRQRVSVYDPLKMISVKNTNQYNSLSEFSENTEHAILCVKPNLALESARSLTGCKSIVSIAAGITLNQISSVMLNYSNIARVMPNLPLIAGEGVAGWCGNYELKPILEEIFSNSSKIFYFSDEKSIDAVTGLSGSGPAFVFAFIQALAEGGVKSGISYQTSLEMAIQVVKGSAILLENELGKTGNHPEEFRNRVTSPGGTTIFGLSKLEECGFQSGVMEAVYAAYLRAKELGKESN